MPKPKTMDLIDGCRSPIRRRIMQLATEAAHQGKTVSAYGLAKALKQHIGSTSYHVRFLAEAGALTLADTRQRRGTFQKLYVPSEAFQATMTDTVALDRIAECLEDGISLAKNQAQLFKLVRATGRPVEA